MNPTHRSHLALALCVALAPLAGCSKKKPTDTAPKPSVQSAAPAAVDGVVAARGRAATVPMR